MSCSGLKQIELPLTITKIESSAFAGCVELEAINLNNNITDIGQRAFAGLPLVPMKVTINELPTNLKTIGGSAFYNGGSNIHITKIPDNVTTIEMMTFYLTPNVSISEFGSDGTGSKLQKIDT